MKRKKALKTLYLEATVIMICLVFTPLIIKSNADDGYNKVNERGNRVFKDNKDNYVMKGDDKEKVEEIGEINISIYPCKDISKDSIEQDHSMYNLKNYSENGGEIDITSGILPCSEYLDILLRDMISSEKKDIEKNKTNKNYLFCAFYDINDPIIVGDILQFQNSLVLIEDKNYEEWMEYYNQHYSEDDRESSIEGCTGIIESCINGSIERCIKYSNQSARSHRFIPIHTKGLMHNKMCVRGTEVITGSYNPVISKRRKFNIVVSIRNKAVSRWYREALKEIIKDEIIKDKLIKDKIVKGEMIKDELIKDEISKNSGGFVEKRKRNNLWKGEGVLNIRNIGLYKGSKRVNESNSINKSRRVSGEIEICFTPSIECREKLISEIKKANKSIWLWLYTLNDEEVIKAIQEKILDGINVSGKLEKDGPNSELAIFLTNMSNIMIENTSLFLHSKMFIIDNKIFIFGSYNPSRNAFLNNYENLVIVRSKEPIFENLTKTVNNILS